MALSFFLTVNKYRRNASSFSIKMDLVVTKLKKRRYEKRYC